MILGANAEAGAAKLPPKCTDVDEPCEGCAGTCEGRYSAGIAQLFSLNFVGR